MPTRVTNQLIYWPALSPWMVLLHLSCLGLPSKAITSTGKFPCWSGELVNADARPAAISLKQRADTIWLDQLPIQAYSEGIRPVKGGSNYQGDTIRMQGKPYLRGIGLQSVSVIPLQVDGEAFRLLATLGADDAGNPTIPIRFFVLGDGRLLYASPPLLPGDKPAEVDINLAGIRRLGLLMTDQTGGIRNKRTYGNWAMARILMRPGHRPRQVPRDRSALYLTPAPRKSPQIHSPRVAGVRPGHPFQYRMAATGQRPMRFTVKGLPSGLTLDAASGIISGMVALPGRYALSLVAENTRGSARQPLEVIVGDTIARTPPLGWNGWNSWAHLLDSEKVLASARAMVYSGLADCGWTYINIDDCWQGVRSGPYSALQPNAKFPDMKGLIEEIHALGLKAGIYSTPYISTYAGYPGGSSDAAQGGETHEQIRQNRQPYMRIGPYRFEEADARQWSEWGIDFLKYDWRIEPSSAERMATALRHCGRDIILSLSNSAPVEKGSSWASVAQMYRTGPDIRDSWNSVYLTTFSLDAWSDFTGPGHWPDPDMMVLGKVSTGASLHPTRLSPDEQYSHMTMNALLSAPLLIGCPLEQLDRFTLNLLTATEVLAVNQDPLGKAPRRMVSEGPVQVWVKDLEGGAKAVGFFHTARYGETPASYFRWGKEKAIAYHFEPESLGMTGTWQVRDAWRQRELGQARHLRFTIPHHGTVLLILRPLKEGKSSATAAK